MRASLVLVLVAISVLCACGPNLDPTAAVTPSAVAGEGVNASGPRISAPPVSPSPPGSNLPAFACADFAGGKTGVANTITARAGEQDSYDRFVLQFDGIVPTYTVKRQAKPVFQMGGSGQNVTLSGTAGVLVSVHSATGATTFTGDTDLIHPEFQVLKEARQVQDFEGYVTWGLGLSKPTCMRVFTLSDPARLVVDLQIPSS